jgi:hypothetical protein
MVLVEDQRVALLLAHACDEQLHRLAEQRIHRAFALASASEEGDRIERSAAAAGS